MKKALLSIMVLFAITSILAIPKRTLSLGGNLSLMIDSGNSSMMQIAPQVGYFVADNLSADLSFNYQVGSGAEVVGLGAGGRYCFNLVYCGAGLMYQSYKVWVSSHEYDFSGGFGKIRMGMLYPLAPNVSVDFGATYLFGTGSFWGDITSANDTKQFSLNAGIQAFIEIKPKPIRYYGTK